MGHFTTLYQKDYVWPPKRKYPPRVGVSGDDSIGYPAKNPHVDRCCCCLQKLPYDPDCVKPSSEKECERMKDEILNGERCCCCMQALDPLHTSPGFSCSNKESTKPKEKRKRDDCCSCCEQKFPPPAERIKLTLRKNDAKVKEEIKNGERCCCCFQKLDDSCHKKSSKKSTPDSGKLKIDEEIKKGERCCCCLQKLPDEKERCACCKQRLPSEKDRHKMPIDDDLKLHVCKTGPRPETEITDFHQPHEFLRKLHAKHPDLYRILHPYPKERPFKRMKVDGLRTTYQIDYDHLDYFEAPDELEPPKRLVCPPLRKLDIKCKIEDRPRLNKDMGEPKEESLLSDQKGDDVVGRSITPWITEYQEIIDRTGATIIKDKIHGTPPKGVKTLAEVWTPCDPED